MEQRITETEAGQVLGNTPCLNCLNPGWQPFFHLEGAPVNSVLLVTEPQAARTFQRGQIDLAFCPYCGFIFNYAFNPRLTEYRTDYESTQSFSPTFEAFSQNLVNELVERYDLHHKEIVEIGCGMGEFLTALCEAGDNRGTGFDPSYLPGRVPNPRPDRLRFIKDFYSDAYQDLQADFFVCKMTLEHISQPSQFLRMVRSAASHSPHAVFFFQVPDVTRILDEAAFWDIYYEHCSYFSPASLRALFESTGFEVLRLESTYAHQYLVLEARPIPGPLPQPPAGLPSPAQMNRLSASLERFQQAYPVRLQAWKEYLDRQHAQGRRVVLWGAGSKAVAFLTALENAGQITYCVDVNPYKHGTYLPGSGQLITPPIFMKDYRPQVVIAMNAVYLPEISQQLEKMGLTPTGDGAPGSTYLLSVDQPPQEVQ